MVEPTSSPQPPPFFKTNFWHSSVSISKREQDLDMMPPPESSMVPISTRRPSINLPSTSDSHSPPLHGLKQEYIDETSQGSIIEQERYRHLSESSLDAHHGDSNMSMINENSMMSHINENSNISVGNEDPVCMNTVNSICESSLDCSNSNMSSIHEDSTCSTAINPTNPIQTLLTEKPSTTVESVMDLRMKMPMVTVADLVNTTAPSIAALQRFGIMEHPSEPLPTQSAQSVENYLNKIEAKPSMIPLTNPTGLLMKNDISQKLSQIISTDSNVYQKHFSMDSCGLLNTREPVFPSSTRPFMSSTTQNEVMNIVAKSESADVAEQHLPEQTMASSTITTVANALERSIPTPINTDRLDALVNSTVESHLSPTKSNSNSLSPINTTTPPDIMIATQDVMLSSQPTLMVPPIINTTTLPSSVLVQTELTNSHASSNLTSEVILNSQISPSLMCRNTSSIQQETLLPPAPNLAMCQPATTVEQALLSNSPPQQSLLSSPQSSEITLTTDPEKVVLLKAAVDLLETQQRISDLGANLQTSPTATTTADTFSRSYGNLTMPVKDLVVPTTQHDKKNVDRMIPQSFTSLTENELINLINPSCFDQATTTFDSFNMEFKYKRQRRGNDSPLYKKKGWCPAW